MAAFARSASFNPSTATGTALERASCNLAVAPRDHAPEILRFTTDLAVPFDNNQAERTSAWPNCSFTGPRGLGLAGTRGSTSDGSASRILAVEDRPMGFAVVHDDEGHRLAGDGPVVEVVNLFLAHLGARQFSPASIRGYAYDLLNFCRFLAERLLGLADVAPSGVFAWLDWYVRTCFHRQR